MSQMNFFESTTWTVGELTRHVRELLEGDPALQDVWVLGEVSNLSRPSSGHLYFTIKDSQASLRCVMWRNAVQRQEVIPRDGDAIEVHGSIGVYEAGGQYQLYADLIRPAGEGALYQEYLRLKARLEAEGLFDLERKRPLPRWARRIGIVTSPTGAALRDMLNTLRRRYPLVEVILAPTPVQGDAAPGGIVNAIENLNRVAKPDVILLARGGGSIEDLWAFNDENVARAIVASQAPVVTGVGHETDFTIADFASDQRAPTPTAAAELVTPDRQDLLVALSGVRERAERAFQALLNERRWGVNGLGTKLQLYSPIARIRSDRQQLDEFSRRIRSSLGHRLRLQRANLQGIEQRLTSLSPAAVLGRGYAIVSHEDGTLVHSVSQVKSGDAMNVQVSDGEFGVRANEIGES